MHPDSTSPASSAVRVEFAIAQPDGGWRRPVTAEQVSAMICELVERPLGADHRAGSKPWSIQIDLAGSADGHLAVTLTWLGDPRLIDAAGSAWGGRGVRLGAHHTRIDSVRITTVAGLALTDEPYPSAWRIQTRSPVMFKRDGRRHPLPDPPSMYQGLAVRLRRHRPHLADVADRDTVDGLTGRLLILDFEIRSGRLLERRLTNEGEREFHGVGFLGWIAIGAPGASEAQRRLFGTLTRFAELAGLGAQTTLGFGAVRVQPTGELPVPGRCTGRALPVGPVKHRLE